jgi:hypothetical protein
VNGPFRGHCRVRCFKEPGCVEAEPVRWHSRPQPRKMRWCVGSRTRQWPSLLGAGYVLVDQDWILIGIRHHQACRS